MKDRRIVAKPIPVTTIHVSGQPHHYFHSEALGACRAVLISPDENLPRTSPPLSKGKQLEILMSCADRLHKRWQAYYDAIYALPENDLKGRNAAFDRLERVHKATSRLSRKIQALILELS